MSTLNGQSLPESLLTRSEVDEWRAELAEIEKIVAAKQARAAELGQLLNAAGVIERLRHGGTLSVSLQAAAQLTANVTQVAAPLSASLSAAIQRVVSQAAGPLTPKAIRNAIVHSPDAALIGSENYIYTAIARAAAKGEIIKTGDGYAPVPPS
jgi:hypothetical protein